MSNRIKWQSADFRVDFATKTIEGVTQISFSHPESVSSEPIVQRLCFRHGSVHWVRLIHPSKHVKTLRYSLLQQGKHEQAWKQIIKNQLSIYGFEQASEESEKVENSGLLVIHGLKNLPKSANSSDIQTSSQMDIEDLTWTVEIAFSVTNPTSGLVFHQDQFLICDQRPCSTMSWIPCSAPSNTAVIYFKEYSVTLIKKPNFLVVSSFPCVGSSGFDEGSPKYRFLVNKSINIAAIGFVAGPLKPMPQSPGLYWRGGYNEKLESKSQFLLQTTEELISEYVDPSELKKMLSSLKIVLVPDIAWFDPVSLTESLGNVDLFLGVPGLAVVDESLFLSEGDEDFSYLCDSVLFKQILMSLLGERLASTRMKADDMWIRVGVIEYITDMWCLWRRRVDGAWILHQKFQNYYRLVENGMELTPLSPVSYPIQEFVCYDQCFSVKAGLVFHLLNSHLELHLLELMRQMLSGSPSSAENQADSPETIIYGELMSTPRLYHHIKFSFGIKNLRFFFRHFINRTGVSRFSIHYEHQTRENKLDLLIKQTPLQAAHFERLERARFKFYSGNSLLEKANESRDPLIPLLQKISSELVPSLTAPLGMNPSALLASLYPSPSSTFLVAPNLCSSRYFRGFLTVAVVESAELDLRSSFYRVNVEEQLETKKSINLLQKIKRKFARRGNHSGNAQGGSINMDAGSIAPLGDAGSTVPPGEDDEEDNIFGASERGGMDNRATNPNQPSSGSGGKSKNLWLQIDPYNAIFKVFDAGYKEEVYHLILNKELKAVGPKQNIGLIFEVLDKLQDFSSEGTSAMLFRCLDDANISPSITLHLARALKKIGSRFYSPRNLSSVLFDLLLRFRFRNRDKRMLLPPPYGGPILRLLKFSMANLAKPLLFFDQSEPLNAKTISLRGFSSLGDNKSMMSIERSFEQSLDNALDPLPIFDNQNASYNSGGNNPSRIASGTVINPSSRRKMVEVGNMLLKIVRERENDPREESALAAALKGVMQIGEDEIYREVADEVEGLLRLSIGGKFKGFDVQRVLVWQTQKWLALFDEKESPDEELKEKVDKIRWLTERLWEMLLQKPFFCFLRLRKTLENQKQNNSLLHAYSKLGEVFSSALKEGSPSEKKAVLLSAQRFLLENAFQLPYLLPDSNVTDANVNMLPILLESHRSRDIAFGLYAMMKAAPFTLQEQPLVPFDKAWFSTVTTTKPLKSQKNTILLRYLTFPKKRRAQDGISLNPEKKKVRFCARDHLLNACNLPLSHPGGLDWRLLARGVLQVLLGDPVTRDLENRLNAAGRVEGTGGGRLGVRLEIEGETLRSILDKLGKNVHISTKYIDFEELYGDVKKVLDNYKKYNQSNVEKMVELENVVDALFHEANMLRSGAYPPSERK